MRKSSELFAGLPLQANGCLRRQNHSLKNNKKSNRGMTLLELVVVVAILAIVATASTSLIIDNGDLKRQLETESRWNQIHDAIISQPNLFLNGSPYISGYVADMGRLPVSILELIRQAETYDHDNNPDTPAILRPYDEDADVGTAKITIDQPDWQSISLGYTASALNSSEIHGGWKGPYLYTAGSREFRDGWYRLDNDEEQDAFNFGWGINTNNQPIAEVVDLIVQSYGSDLEPGFPREGGQFTEDFPVDATQTIVSQNEWALNTAAITFNINFSNAIRAADTLPPVVGSDPHQLQLRIYRYVDNGDSVADDSDILKVSADATFTLTDGASVASTTITPEEADFSATPAVRGMPIGRYAALIWCTNNTPSDNSDDAVYDGDCNSNDPSVVVDHSPVNFTLTNNTTQVTLTWHIP